MSQETVTTPTADEPSTAPGTDDTQATPQPAEQPDQAQDQPSEGAEQEPLTEESETDANVKELYKRLDEAGLSDLKKHNSRVFTQKTQEIAARRADVEKQAKELEQSAALIAALRENPQDTVRNMAKQLGLSVAEPQQQQQAENKAVEKLEALFGPDVTQQMLPALREIAQEMVQPLQQTVEQDRAAQAQKTAEGVWKQFQSDNPDWQKHEAGMADVAKRIVPQVGTSQRQYLDMLLFLAKRDNIEADAAQKAVARINQAAATAENPRQGVPSNRVAPAPPKDIAARNLNDQFEAAVDAARRGEVWRR